MQRAQSFAPAASPTEHPRGPPQHHVLKIVALAFLAGSAARTPVVCGSLGAVASRMRGCCSSTSRQDTRCRSQGRRAFYGILATTACQKRCGRCPSRSAPWSSRSSRLWNASTPGRSSSKHTRGSTGTPIGAIASRYFLKRCMSSANRGTARSASKSGSFVIQST